MDFLIDHDIEGQARLLLETIRQEGWLEYARIQFREFHDVGLARNASDREVWRRAQERQMCLITENRQMKGSDSLEETLRQELTPQSLPVLTVRDKGRLQSDVQYRRFCAEDVADIASNPEALRGTDRLFIPFDSHFKP